MLEALCIWVFVAAVISIRRLLTTDTCIYPTSSYIEIMLWPLILVERISKFISDCIMGDL